MIGIRTSILSEHEKTEWAIDDPLRFYKLPVQAVSR